MAVPTVGRREEFTHRERLMYTVSASIEVFNVLHAVRDWTAKDIAEIAGVSQATVANWRSGRTKWPRIDKLAAVARVAGVRFALVPKESIVRNEVVAPRSSRRRNASSYEIRAN